MGRYVIKRKDGGITIMTTVGDATPEACIAKWTVADQANVVSIEEIDPASVPQDRTFRNAWTHGSGFDVDMVKARDIWRDKMRMARQPKLAEADVEYMRADETKNENGKNDVVQRKQELRDVTEDPRIEAAQTPDELKQVWDAELLGDEIPKGIPK